MDLLTVIAVNGFGGLVGQIHYVNLDWLFTLSFLLASVAGMCAGAALAKHLSATVLRRGFAWLVVLLGVALIARNLAGLIGIR